MRLDSTAVSRSSETGTTVGAGAPSLDAVPGAPEATSGALGGGAAAAAVPKAVTETVTVPTTQAAPKAATNTSQQEREWVDYTSEMTISRYAALRIVYLTMGFVAIGLGIAGYLLPGLPGTVFILIAAWAFGQSSPRFYNWLMNHPQLGKLIRDYRSGKGIPLWVKYYAPVMIVTFSAWSAYRLAFVRDKPWIGLSIVIIAIYGVWYVLQVPTAKPEEREGPKGTNEGTGPVGGRRFRLPWQRRK